MFLYTCAGDSTIDEKYEARECGTAALKSIWRALFA